MRSIIFFLYSFLLLSACSQQEKDLWKTVVLAENKWFYKSCTTKEPSVNWNAIDFDESQWKYGKGGFGYGDNDDHTIIDSTRSLYLRHAFEINDVQALELAVLHADYDDAFIAYLNGQEIARANIGINNDFQPFDGKPNHDHEAVMYKGGTPEYFEITNSELSKSLVKGKNVLAVHVINQTLKSSDLTAKFYLSVKSRIQNHLFSPTPAWFKPPVKLEESNLPILSINTQSIPIPDEPKINAKLSILYDSLGGLNRITDDKIPKHIPIKIEMRGSSSQKRFPKKSYGFKTITEDGKKNNVSLLDLPKENDWILYGPYSDKSMIRNVLAFQLSNDIHKYAPRTRFCELVINEKYQGVYVLKEKIKRDKHRVDLKKSSKNNLGGFIIKLDKKTGSGGEGWYSSQQPKSYKKKKVFFQFDYPKSDRITEEQKVFIQKFFADFETTLISDQFDDPINGYKKFISTASFIDFFILNELAYNVDAYRLSTFLYKEDSKESKLHIGPIWDFNLSFGNGYDCNKQNSKGFMFEYNTTCPNKKKRQIPFWWSRLLEDEEFKSELLARWKGLRENVLHLDNIYEQIDQQVKYLEHAQKRNFIRWPIINLKTWPNLEHTDSYEKEIVFIKKWIKDRIEWLDQNIPKL